MNEIEYTESELLLFDIRTKRDILLKHIDKFQNILVFEDLTEKQKEELRIYRRQLLDAPENLKLPKAPDWLFDGI